LESPIGDITLSLLLVVFLVLLNAFFVAAEFSLVKVRQTRLTQLVNEGNNSRAEYAQKVTRQLDTYLSACQLGITIASLGLGWIGEPAIAYYLQPLLLTLNLPIQLTGPISLVFAFILITFLHIVFGELAPKSLAIQKAESTSLWVAAPLMLFYTLSYPVIRLLNGAANLLLKWLGLRPATDHESAHTEEEIRLLVNQSHKSGHIDQTELALVDKVFVFSERLAREIMIPRIEMLCLYDDFTYEESLQVIRTSRHSRYPVAHEDKDRLIGFVHASDFYLAALSSGHADLKSLMRPLLAVPESMEISHVLRLMQKQRSQLAIVIDEYGGTAGLLTMEDILEELVGEIQDEFDEHERPEIEIFSPHKLSVSGKTLLTLINDYIDIEVLSNEVDTIAGWLYNQLNGAVGDGRSVMYQRYLFTISEWQQHRITRVLITYVGEDETTTSP
jgi:CBS domain containing-hemolysin-like protein